MPHTVTAGCKFAAGHQEEAGRTSNQRDSRGRSDERGTPRIGNSTVLSFAICSRVHGHSADKKTDDDQLYPTS